MPTPRRGPRGGATHHGYDPPRQLRLRRGLRPRVRRASLHLQRARLHASAASRPRSSSASSPAASTSTSSRTSSTSPSTARSTTRPRRSASTSTTAGPSSSAPPTARSCTGCAAWSSAAPGSTSASRRASSTSPSTPRRRRFAYVQPDRDGEPSSSRPSPPGAGSPTSRARLRSARSRRRPSGAPARQLLGESPLAPARPRLGDRLGALLADEQLGAQRAAATRSSAGKRPAAGQRRVERDDRRLAAERLRRRWRSPSASRRRRCCARPRAPGARPPAETPSSVSISTTAWPPRAATRLAVSTARSTAWACASGAAASVSGGDRLDRAGLATRRPPRGARRRARRCTSRPSLAGERGGEAAQRLGLARRAGRRRS